MLRVHVWRGARDAGPGARLAILGRYLRREVGEGEIVCDAQGKPALRDASLHFSVSHSGGWSAMAVSTAPVGLDLERVVPLPELEDLVAVALHPAERAAFRSCGVAEREAFFYRCWTRKEALLKVMGCGLARDPRGVDTLQVDAWRLREVVVMEGHVACVASPLFPAIPRRVG